MMAALRALQSKFAEGMDDIIRSICPFQVLRTVVSLVSVFMVDLSIICGGQAKKCRCYQAVNAVGKPPSMLIEPGAKIAMPRWLRPKNTTYDSASSTSDALDAPKAGNLIQCFITDYVAPFFHFGSSFYPYLTKVRNSHGHLPGATNSRQTVIDCCGPLSAIYAIVKAAPNKKPLPGMSGSSRRIYHTLGRMASQTEVR